MDDEFEITVREILNSPYFHDAQVLAGTSGLDRTVKWVHILEVREFVDQLVNGHELILTTGIGFTGEEVALSFMEQLIGKNVSGLCIELVSYFTEVPEQMIRMANQYNFPLIGFTNIKRFVDITHHLHTMIINKDKQMFSLVDSFSEHLNALLLSVHDFRDLLDYAHQYLNINVAFIPQKGDPLFIPALPSPKEAQVLKNFAPDPDQELSPMLATKPVMALDKKWGDLCFFSFDRSVNRLESLILEKCTRAVAQDILRELYGKEKRSEEDNIWVKKWLHGELKEDEIFDSLKFQGYLSQFSGYVICLVEVNTGKMQKPSKEFSIQFTIICRSFFAQQGFELLPCPGQNELVFILLDTGNRETWTARVKKSLDEINKNKYLTPYKGKIILGIGKIVDQVTEIKNSWETAADAVHIQKRLKINEPLYDSLHIYRLISRLDQMSYLHSFVLDYLKPLMEYDTHNQGDLINTLKVFFECNCSKQRTAEQLFIARQTLYFRLQKIEDLLGADFMVREKRIAIEFALCAYDYMKNSV